MMKEREKWCGLYINRNYNPANPNDTVFLADTKDKFIRSNSKAKAKELNTCQSWHEYVTIYFKEYLKSVKNILLMFIDKEGKRSYYFYTAKCKRY